MKCSCSLTPILAIVGLLGLGAGGYNMLRTGCPLGTCHGTEAAAVTQATTVVPVSAAAETPATGECPMKCHGESMATEAKPEIKTVAHTSTNPECTDGEHCCKGSGDACCKGMSESECAEHMKHEAAAQSAPTIVPVKDHGAN